jgi:uncharacterized membrane protein HdeD (DUF308 family)
MTSKIMRVLNIVAGVILIAIGIYCLCNQDIAAVTAGFMVGIFMFVSGIIELVVFAATSRLLIGSGWLLLDGVLTVILSLFLLFNQWFTMLSLPFLFTLWLLFSGISRFVSALDLKALDVRGWGWVLAVGIILMIAGFICMMDPWVSITAIGMTIGLVFLLEGISSIIYACIPRTR